MCCHLLWMQRSSPLASFLHRLQVWPILFADLSRNSKFNSNRSVCSQNPWHCCWHPSYGDHVTLEGHVTLFICEHVLNPAILLTFWRQIMKAFQETCMRNEYLLYFRCIHAKTARWQAFFTYDGHLTDRCFENWRAFGVHTHTNMKVGMLPSPTKIADDVNLKFVI